MSEEIAWAAADLAHARRMQARARRWKRCAGRLWARLGNVEQQRRTLERQLLAHRALAERLDVFAATVLPSDLTPLQRMLWAEVQAALAMADASIRRAGGGGGGVE